MPLVEVLPNSASAAAPGWTYVVDTGYDPSKVALNPKDRKRVAARPGGARGENDLSARQQTSIARRIAELDRDNDPRQNIAVPGKTSAPKTQNARRILQYQRQIRHWLDDEEAMLLQAQQAPVPVRGAGAGKGAVGASLVLRKMSTMVSGPGTPIEATPAPTPTLGLHSTPASSESVSPLDQLLSIESSMPPPINPAELEALLSAPPLSYAASHVAAPPAGGPPQRQFCDNCGYWGTMKCRKCGARVCGLECKEAHEATRCLKWA
jgi:zinc finger HIT domain-containing protein 1